MRYTRVYFPTPVPLLTLRWHRIAIDDWQMLGSSSQLCQPSHHVGVRNQVRDIVKKVMWRTEKADAEKSNEL